MTSVREVHSARRGKMLMMRDQRGGIISKVFIIPAGVVVIISVFLLGYYMGRGQGKRTASTEKLPALPDVVSKYIPKTEDLTFYKTLTEKGEKSVSIDLKPKAVPEDHESRKQTAEKPAVQKTEPRTPEPRKQPPAQPARKEPPAASAASSKVRYTIQVGAYPERGLAEDDVRNMKKRGYVAFVVATDLPDKGTWYRVRIGSFSKRDSAEKLAAELKSKEGIDSFITAE
jgi:cell division septation protein DedD